jgi:hypothetical protein
VHAAAAEVEGKLPAGGSAVAKPTITVYIEPARTRNSLFLSHRLVAYSSGKYEYKHVILNSKLSRNVTAFRHETCIKTPGFKVFVGHGELVLRNWPGNSIWMITGDEAGDWGLKRKGKYFGLHGPSSKMFPTEEDHPLGRIILPTHAKPWFRQYFDSRQTEAFGNDARFLPLGSRIEYPEMSEKVLLPAPERSYIFSCMIGITDPARARLHLVLLNDTLIPKENTFVHISKSWHANANHAEYVAPEKYAEVMLDSIFALCPKGHSVEQFRIYEAIEAGAIPVMEMTEQIQQKFPPEYFESGMLFVKSWEDAPKEMASLAEDKLAIAALQAKLLNWYKGFMSRKLVEIEESLEAQQPRMDPTVCGCVFDHPDAMCVPKLENKN